MVLDYYLLVFLLVIGIIDFLAEICVMPGYYLLVFMLAILQLIFLAMAYVKTN